MNWKKLKIKDFAEVITGGTPSTTKKEYWDKGTIPWLSSGDLNQATISSSSNFITKQGLESSSTKLMPPNTVLIALTGATTGVTAYLNIEACANQSVTGVLPSEMHHPKFLYYYLRSIRSKIINDSYGGAQKHISQGYVKEITVPIPCVPVQQKIAAILEQADVLRKKDQQLIAKYDELLQSVFYKMFGDPVKNEKGWKKKELQDFGEWKTGGTPSRSNPSFFEGNIPWITSGELNEIYIEDSFEKISEEALKKSNTKKIEIGSILLGMYDTAALKSSINNKIITCNQAIAYSKLDDTKCNTLFIYHYIQMAKEHLRRMQRGVRQKNMNLTMIKETETISPPITLQNEFAITAQNVQKQKQLVKQQIQKSENLFQSLLQKAFKGELIS
jgi:type I restriction enzyme, S subunit